MSWYAIWIHHADPSPGETMLHLFCQQHTAAIFSGYTQNQRIPPPLPCLEPFPVPHRHKPLDLYSLKR